MSDQPHNPADDAFPPEENDLSLSDWLAATGDEEALAETVPPDADDALSLSSLLSAAGDDQEDLSGLAEQPSLADTLPPPPENDPLLAETQPPPPVVDLPLADHEMPTRRIRRVDFDALDETRVSGSPVNADPLGMARPTGDEDPYGPTQPAGTVRDGFQAVEDWFDGQPAPADRRPTPSHGLRRTEIQTRTYGTELPYSVPQTGDQPPVYGGLEDRPSQGQRRRRTARERRDSGLYLPWWSLLIMLAVVAFFAAFLFMGLNLLGGQFAPGGVTNTPIVLVITSTPTLPPTFTPPPTLPAMLASPTVMGVPAVATAPPTDTPDGSPPLILSPVSTDIPQPDPSLALRIGATIAILGTEGAGLNVRSGAGVIYEVLFIAPEDSRYEVISGPLDADGFIWWQVRNLEDPNNLGWGVADFMAVVP